MPKKKLSRTLTLLFNNHFPSLFKNISKKKHIVTLGIGGNVGNTKQIFNKFFLAIQNDSRFDIIQTSPLLKNPPFGFLEQSYFLNAIIVIKTSLSPIEVLNEMQRYENRFGRKRSFKDAPRTLDIDIIFYDKLKIKHYRLIVPHLNYENRDSVLIPLKYLKLIS